MIVIHGAFGRQFFLWSECSFTRTGLHNLRRLRRAGGEEIIAHIWDPGRPALLSALEELGFGYAHRLPAGKMEILLPTLAEKYPVPSTPLLGEIPKSHIKREATYSVRKWLVDHLPIDVMDMRQLLGIYASAPEPTRDGCLIAPGVMMALDLCYMMECYRFAISLIERGRFLPDLRVMKGADSERVYESVWRPLLIGEDAERFVHLKNSIPPILTVLRRSGRSAEQIASTIFDYIIDRLVRFSWARNAKETADGDDQSHRRLATALLKGAAIGEGLTAAERKKRGKLVSGLNPHHLWARSLGWFGDAEGMSQALATIYQDVKEWRNKFEWFTKAPVKLCLSLTENSGQWRLEYLIRYLETGEIIPVKEVWAGDATASSLDSNNIRRYLMLLLGRIGTSLPPVMKSLELTAPTGADLSFEDAERFLSTGAATVINKGIAVEYPEWWERASSDRLTFYGRLIGGAPVQTKNGFDWQMFFNWELALGGEILTTEETEAIFRTTTPLIKIRGEWRFIMPDRVERAKKRMNDLPQNMTSHEALQLAVRLAYVDGFINAPELEQSYSALMKCAPREIADVPESMLGVLRPYQLRGYSWLRFLSDLGMGACLADDMGLGKTVQTLAMIQSWRDRGERRSVLLICPTSVLENWRLEINKFFPQMSHYIHHGRGREKGDEFVRQTTNRAVVLTSYALLQRDAQLFAGVEWAGIVLDEAQNIKNPETQQARIARSLKSDWRVVLTGTPVENHVGDLWSIMEFLMPGMLGSRRRFANEYLRPIQESRDPIVLGDLKSMVAPFIMRRMKTDKDIAPELPQKIETKVFCGLKKEQAALYGDIASGLTKEIAASRGIRRKGLVLAALTRLKQVCDHPSLATKDGVFDIGRSAKLERLVDLAEEMNEAGDKTLIFTQYVEMGEILKRQLQDHFGREVMFLHGAVFKEARDQMVKRFQEDDGGPRFFVLSLKAGGVGLNLTRANHVVMYDRWWNPAVEQQAIDRAYRIGQKRNVHVHVFCCNGTLEERIDELLTTKAEIAREITGDGENWLTELSDAELQRLLQLSPTAFEA